MVNTRNRLAGHHTGYKMCVGKHKAKLVRIVVQLDIPPLSTIVSPSRIEKKKRCSHAIPKKMTIVCRYYTTNRDTELINSMKENCAYSFVKFSENKLFKYQIGNKVKAIGFDKNPNVVCSGGIHFFDSFKDAASYNLF